MPSKSIELVMGGLVVLLISMATIGICLFKRRSKKNLQASESQSKAVKADLNKSSGKRLSNGSMHLPRYCGPPPVIIVTLADPEDGLLISNPELLNSEKQLDEANNHCSTVECVEISAETNSTISIKSSAETNATISIESSVEELNTTSVP